MSRAPRTTKKQKEYMISYLEENRLLLGGKVNPVDIPKVNNGWKDLTGKLNSLGPAKTVKQWKDTISEMKTNVRRRSRDVTYGHRGTGGGAPVKPLTDLEIRILGLISNLTIEGVNLEEAGAPTDEYMEPVPLAGPSQTTPEEIEVTNVEFEVIHVEPSVSEEREELGTKENQTPLKKKQVQKIKRRPQGNRLESAIKSHDRQLTMLAKSNFAIAKSINNLARSKRLLTQRR